MQDFREDKELARALMLDRLSEEEGEEILEELAEIITNRAVLRYMRGLNIEEAKKWEKLAESKSPEEVIKTLVAEGKLGKIFIEEAHNLRKELIGKLR